MHSNPNGEWEPVFATSPTGNRIRLYLGPDENDKSIKVWNLDSYSNSHSLESHTSWIRALATDKEVLAGVALVNAPPSRKHSLTGPSALVNIP